MTNADAMKNVPAMKNVRTVRKARTMTDARPTRNPRTKNAPVPVTWESLRERIELGDADGVLDLLWPHSPAELKHLLKDLVAHRTWLRAREGTDRWEVLSHWQPLLTAAALCVVTPAQAASWFGAGGGGTVRLLVTVHDTPDPAVLLTSRRDKAWTGDLALRLAAKLTASFDFVYWRFVEDLVRHSGVDVPLNAGYMAGWLWAARWERHPQRRHATPIRLADWLRQQPRLREHVLTIFELDGVGDELIEHPRSQMPTDDGWSIALRELTEAGLLDRGELLDASAARLVSGDRPGSLRGFLAFFEGLEPSAAEVRQRVSTFSAMAASGVGTVAKYAQRELRAVDAQEPFDPRDLAELSESVLARPETGIAGAQLTWLDAALKRDPGAAAVLLPPSLGAAFVHPSSGVQQKAIKLLAKHCDKVTKADDAIMAGLRAAAMSLDPALKAEADLILGEGDSDGIAAPDDGIAALGDAGPAELPAYHPQPLPPLPLTPGELVTAFAASYNSRAELGALEVEQLMAATVIAAHRDRDALAAAFRPLADRHANDPFRALEYWQLESFPGAVRSLFHAVVGEDYRIGRRVRIRVVTASDASPTMATLLRIQELTDALLLQQVVPVLLATPTESNGAIDPAVFAERLALYEAEGIDPLPFDVEHARMRVWPEQSRRIEDDERALAELLAPDALSARTMEELGKARIGAVTSPRSKMWEQVVAAPSVHAVLYPQLAWDGKVRWPLLDLMGPVHEGHRWTILLPHDPDQVAAHALGLLHEQSRGGNREPVSIFPALAETAGVPGPVTHLALCYGLAAERAENRVGAQDALLILAARGLLRPELLGVYGAELWQRGMIRGSRLLETLGQAEQAGMAAEGFAVCAALIHGLARDPDTRGLPDLLLLTTRCAVSAGIRGVDVPGLGALAALPKPKRVAAEAKRLKGVIES
jgi:hypothetical protein